MEKLIMFVLIHSANFNTRGTFVVCSDYFTDECFQRAVHVKGSERSTTTLFIPTRNKRSEKKFSARTRGKVRKLNLNAVEVIVSFSLHLPLRKTYFLLTSFKSLLI